VTSKTASRLALGALLATGAALSPAAAADAEAARYVARPADGGRITIDAAGSRLRRIAARLPSGCESNVGQTWTTPLAIQLTGDEPLRSGRFSIQGQAPNKVRYQIDGRRRGRAISGRIRLTFLDLDFVGADESFLCDTGTIRFRAVRRR
jgi:hypothetical protein